MICKIRDIFLSGYLFAVGYDISTLKVVSVNDSVSVSIFTALYLMQTGCDKLESKRFAFLYDRRRCNLDDTRMNHVAISCTCSNIGSNVVC